MHTHVPMDNNKLLISRPFTLPCFLLFDPNSTKNHIQLESFIWAHSFYMRAFRFILSSFRTCFSKALDFSWENVFMRVEWTNELQMNAKLSKNEFNRKRWESFLMLDEHKFYERFIYIFTKYFLHASSNQLIVLMLEYASVLQLKESSRDKLRHTDHSWLSYNIQKRMTGWHALIVLND